MQKEIKIFENTDFNVKVVVDDAGNYQFDAESVAVSLGLTERKAGKEYVMWRRVNQYLKLFGTSAEISRGSYIPEPAVYKLTFKANNEVAENFQDWLAMEVLPAIRKTGSYSAAPEPQETISARELAAMLKRKQCKVCYRIDGILKQHPEYRTEFLLDTFVNAQGRSFRTYNLTDRGLRLFVQTLERDGNRNSVNTVKGLQRIKGLYPVDSGRMVETDPTEVSLCPRIALKEWQKAEAALEMFEQCYLGEDYSTFDEEDRERFDSALCLLHDQVKLAVMEMKEGVVA